jgi:hypothetical protein
MQEEAKVVKTIVSEVEEAKPSKKIKKASEGIKTVKKEVIVDNTVEMEGVKETERSTYKMQVELMEAEAQTEVSFIVTYKNGNKIKKQKRLTTILEKDIVNPLGYLRYQVAPRMLEEKDPEFIKVLKVTLV